MSGQLIMQLSTFVLSLLLQRAWSTDNYYNRTLHLSPSIDNEGCWSFKHVQDAITDSTKVVITTRSITLNKTVLFQNYTSIALVGHDHSTTITCHPQYASRGAGLLFVEVRGLEIRNLKISNCGSQNTLSYTLWSALHIVSSMDVSFKNGSIINSNGRGLALLNTYGGVTIENITFSNTNTKKSRGGGVWIEFAQHSINNIYNSSYTIGCCKFLTNEANGDSNYSESGGGILVNFSHAAANNHILISNSTFTANTAVGNGGACNILFTGSSNHNSVTFNHVLFTKNKAKLVGGALSISFIYPYRQFYATLAHDNRVLCNNCNFTANTALYGGGVGVSSCKISQALKHRGSLEFRDCKWNSNTVKADGSAVDMALDDRQTHMGGWVPILPVFNGCEFHNNHQYKYRSDNATLWRESTFGRGTLFVAGFDVEFRGHVVFEGNTLSAVYLVSSIASFGNGIRATFRGNVGFNGGAICMHGTAALHVQDNSIFIFTNNTAESKGGAMYSSSIGRRNFVSTSCFIQYRGSRPEGDIVMHFVGNQAHGRRNAISSSSLLPCYRRCKGNKGQLVEKPFQCIGKFQYGDEYGASTNVISTAGKSFRVHTNKTIKAVPGREFILPLTLLDELGTAVNETLHVAVVSSSASGITVDHNYSFIHNFRLTICGQPGTSGYLQVSSVMYLSVAIVVPVELLQCPPGFLLSNDTGSMVATCICSADSKNTYVGITHCENFKAYVRREFWVGYGQYPTNQDSLLIGYCPFGLCRQHYTRDNISTVLLPGSTSVEKLDWQVCGPKRTGTLCAKCRKGLSVFYHARHLDCKRDSGCSIGWLFYIVSEIIPLTLFYTVILALNLSFTSGVANSFILFAQLFDIAVITADGAAWITNAQLLKFTKAVHFVYRLFNLEFFTEEYLSFCLWKGSSSLDIIAFKYVTIAYGFLLIALTTVLTKINPFNITHGRKQVSVIHGLTSFLVLCYSQCVKVTFQILTPTTLYGISKEARRRVVQHNGELIYFSPQHLVYAIPAMVCLFTIVLLPPLLLLLYPLHYHLLDWMRINETKYTRLVPLDRLKPMFDSFQGCYKDKYRFFSGLYFVVRLCTGITSAFAHTNAIYYTVMEIMLLTFIILLSYCQPYQKSWHNAVDTLILTDYIIINILSLFNYSMNARGSANQTHRAAHAIHAVQVILALLPLVYITTYVMSRLVHYRRPLGESTSRPTDEMELPVQMVLESDCSDESQDGECEYQLYDDDEDEDEL